MAVLSGLVDLVFPAVCPSCRAATAGPDAGPFCAACLAHLSADPFPACPHCAATVGPFTHLDHGCPACRGAGFRFEGAVRLGPYDGKLRDLVLAAKSARGRDTAEHLGRLFARCRRDHLRAAGVDVVVPVPLHWGRRLLRGYNQAESLAGELADALRLPCRPRWLARSRPTPFLSSLPPSRRAEVVRGAFRASRACRGRAVLLVDDVMTTGSTADACARALRAAGAVRVVAAALARA